MEERATIRCRWCGREFPFETDEDHRVSFEHTVRCMTDAGTAVPNVERMFASGSLRAMSRPSRFQALVWLVMEIGAAAMGRRML